MNSPVSRDSTSPICVVVPVFNAPQELDACLASVAATVGHDAQVLVIDDASTDPATEIVINRWKDQAFAGWTFESSIINRGFVATANAGMRACKNDVVLLNSDTVVTPGWIQGLQRCLASDPSIATATPWTNNGEIASIPDFCQVNPVPQDLRRIAAVIAQAGTAHYPEIPTAVGFCMALSRSAIEQVGFFDEVLFGKGYGEENDFSRRAVNEGLRNVLCDDIYIAHFGGRSFGPTGLKPDQSSMERLLSKHPDYLERVQTFIDSDPLASRRKEILQALNLAGVPIG